MKKFTFLLVFNLIVCLAFSQTIFKGLDYGMSPNEAKKEFKSNKSAYDSVDFGNGFVWRLFFQNFIYENNELVGVLFSPKGALFGVGHDATTSYLEFSRAFFEHKEYTVFFEPEYWQYPLNFNSTYGLLMCDKDKSIVVQLYPFTSGATGTTTYFPYMKVLNYDWFMKQYNNHVEILEEKSENSGF